MRLRPRCISWLRVSPFISAKNPVETTGPSVAFVPLNTNMHVENIGDSAQYIYVSIGRKISTQDGLQMREACDRHG